MSPFILCLLICFAILGIILLFHTSEKYQDGPSDFDFTIYPEHQWKGINILGVNSEDASTYAVNVPHCMRTCASIPECKAFSYYAPGQRCFMYTSGEAVPNGINFTSGRKNTI